MFVLVSIEDEVHIQPAVRMKPSHLYLTLGPPNIVARFRIRVHAIVSSDSVFAGSSHVCRTWRVHDSSQCEELIRPLRRKADARSQLDRGVEPVEAQVSTNVFGSTYFGHHVSARAGGSWR